MYYLKTGTFRIMYYKVPELTNDNLKEITIKRFRQCMAIPNIEILSVHEKKDKCYSADYCFEVAYNYPYNTSGPMTCTICFDEVTEEEYIENHLLK